MSAKQPMFNARLKVLGIDSHIRGSYRQLRKHWGFTPRDSSLIIWGMVREAEFVRIQLPPGKAIIAYNQRVEVDEVDDATRP